MANSVGYSDENGYFTKRAIAEIAINAYLLTSEGKLGEDILEKVSDTEIDEGLNSVLQNAKQRMQILRVLGLVSTDYDSEIYAITDLGYKVLERAFPTSNTCIPNYSLLRETFMGISTSSEIYEHNVDFNSYLGYEICYAFSCLDYRIGTSEMPMITTYAIDEIDEFIKTIQDIRKSNGSVQTTHHHYPQTQKGTPLKQASNITRTINQILRICGIIENKEKRINGVNYYVCTEFGKQYVDDVKKFMKNKSSKLYTAQQFRKENLLRQKELCNVGYNNMLDKGGYSVEVTDKNTVFSPYQMIPETNVNWFLGKRVRKPPELKEAKLQAVNSRITGQDLRLKPIFISQDDYDNFIRTHISQTNLIKEILAEKEKGTVKTTLIQTLCERYKNSDKSTFYPFVHSLFKAMGLECCGKGEVGRVDGLFEYNGVKIPAEIKSFTETSAYNMKGARQALENKILVYKQPSDLQYASLLIGYYQPSSTTEIQEFINAVYEELNIKIVALDLYTIVVMCVNTIWDKQKVDFDRLLSEHGIAEV